MKILVYSSLLIYFVFYLFEGPMRYGMNLIGMDSLIFIRDIILIIPLLLIFLRQLVQKNLHPAFYIFALIIVIHGLISILNIRDVFVVMYCVKILLTVLVGAVLAPYLMNPPKQVVMVVFAFWLITFISVFLDKYFVEYPWIGLGTTIGDIQVEISRDWEVSGADKRAGGLMRSSINVAAVTPLMAFILLFNIRAFLPRLAIMVMTGMVLYWTTQKASILAFAFVCGILLVAYRRPVPMLKIGISLAFILMIALPLILPQFSMPHDRGVFSMQSFYMRIEEVWPQAWLWIERHEAFPFGVGLGGIGGAMRLYAIDSVNYADNMFIFLYAWFGVLSFAYMGWLWWACMRVSNQPHPAMTQASCIILFIIYYGVAMSMIEDQMTSLFLGAAATWIASNNAKREAKNNEE